MIIGYARVSTGDQNISTQIELLKTHGCDKIFTDKASGVKTDRQGLNQMIENLRPGDTIIIYKSDRLFRSLKNMVQLIELFNSMGVKFKSLSEPPITNCITIKYIVF